LKIWGVLYVIPASAGIRAARCSICWIPASAGMTDYIAIYSLTFQIFRSERPRAKAGNVMPLNKLEAAAAEFKKFCRNYFRNVMDITIRSILLLIGTAVLNLIVLYFYNILWHILRLTYSGNRFTANHPKFTQLVSDLLNNDMIEIAVETTFSAFTICIIVCAICQVLYITRYLFNPQNSIIKLLFWGLPLTSAVSMYINDIHQFEHWAYTFPITVVPTLCVFTYCFKFTEDLLPEIGSVFVKIFFYLKALWAIAPQRGR
jgi:hypothetical protein